MILDDNHRQQARQLRRLKGERALDYADERIGYLQGVGDVLAARHWRIVRAYMAAERDAMPLGV